MTNNINPLQKARTHADRIFAALFTGLTPAVAGLAYVSTSGTFTPPICSATGGPPNVIGGGWQLALVMAGLAALGSLLIARYRPGKPFGAAYNAIAAMVFTALIMHFGGGSGEAHFPFFIFISFLLYYRAWQPIALACAFILTHHLLFFALQRAGMPVVLFGCLDETTLAVHFFAGIGQCTLLGYIAARMEKNDLALTRSAAAEKLAAKVFHTTIEGIMITDAQGRIESVNPAFTQITGYSDQDVIGQTPRVLKSQHHDAAFYRQMWQEVEASGQWKGEIWNRRKSGEVFLESQTIQRIQSDDGNARYVAVFNDITEQWRKDKRIEHLAFHDSLTGLANRSLLADRIKQAIALADRAGSSLAVMLVDLDRFKDINDSFGHEQGDELLKAVTRRLQEEARMTDTIARLGGDEFVLVLQPIGQPEDAGLIAARIIGAIATPIELSGLSLRVGASVGVALYPGDGVDATSLLKSADTAMYEAKDAGKGTYRFFNAGMTNRAQARLHLEMGLRRAVEQNEFELHFQPKICLHHHSTCGAEVLIRWRRPMYGLVPPIEFIPLAEETGLIEPIGTWVLEQACRQLSEWRAKGIGLTPLAVNVSALQLQRGTLAATISVLLSRYQLPGHVLEIELTESAVMSNPAAAIESMKALRALGLKISVDDFGTGHSSLAYLKRLPIDALKVDRSFVMEADRNEESAVIVGSIIALAKSLKLEVVAEGIESAEQLALLKGQGCNVGQGYYFSRPLPEEEMENWLIKERRRDCRQCAQKPICAQTGDWTSMAMA